MGTATRCRRKTRRHTISGSADAWVELTFPVDGGPKHRLPLTDISVSGLSFAFEAELAGVEAGTDLHDVEVRLGECVVRGELVVMHVTQHSDTRRVCGALFYAAGDTDLIKWRSALSGMGLVD